MIWRVLPALLLACLSPSAGAATQDDLAQVNAALRRVAAPWCGRLAELDAQGLRRCTIASSNLGLPGVGNAFAWLGTTFITDELLAALSIDELAAVMGHELAHLVLGHSLVRLRQQQADAPSESGSMLLSLVEAWGVNPHEQTPADPRLQELDADTLGLVFAGMAGYDVRRGAALWRTASRRIPGWASHASASHPSDARRLAHALAVADSFCRDVAVSRPPWLTSERLLPAYELGRDEARQSLDRKVVIQACSKASMRKTKP